MPSRSFRLRPRELTPLHHIAITTAIRDAEATLAAGRCPECQLALTDGPCVCGFRLDVLPPFVPRGPLTAAFWRRPTKVREQRRGAE